MKFNLNDIRKKKQRYLVVITLLIIIANLIIQSPISLEVNHTGFDSIRQSKDIVTVNEFDYYKTITIDHKKVSGPDSLSNFPLLVSIIDSDLKKYAQSCGNDIAFFSGITQLDHETEYYNSDYTDTQAWLVAWIRIPNLSSSIDTRIDMYFGNSTIYYLQNPKGVWGSNFAGVWHLSEDPTAKIYDSTSNHNDGISYGCMTSGDQLNGKIGGSIDFDGNNDYIDIPSLTDADFSYTDELTLSAWINPKEKSWQSVISNTISDEALFTLRTSFNSNKKMIFGISTTNGWNYVETHSKVLQLNEWSHVAGVYNSTDIMIFVDGDLMGSKPHSGNLNRQYGDVYSVKLGSEGDGCGNNFNGLIDDPHISYIPRSADWIKTEYNNQYNPNIFYSIGHLSLVKDLIFVNDFKYYKTISINHQQVSGSNDLYNFPLLVSIIDSDLKNFAQTCGNDIAFFSGNTQLDHETEHYDYDYSDTQVLLVAWIRIPCLSSSTDTKIDMYFGNSTFYYLQNPIGVWDDNFVMVNHLSGSSYTNLKDSTYNNNDVASVDGTPTCGTTGKINNGVLLRAVCDEGLIIPDSRSLDIEDELTLSAWVKASSIEEYNRIIVKSHTQYEAPYTRYDLSWSDSPNHRISISDDNNNRVIVNGTTSINTHQWYYLTGTVSESATTIYLNGIYENHVDSSLTIATNDVPLTIGMSGYPGNYRSHFDGIIDEVRISKTSRSAGWIATEYNNQNDPNTFYSIGPLKPVIHDDHTPPMTTLIYNGNPNNYINNHTEFILFADDGTGSGVNFTNYRVDNDKWNLYTIPFTIIGYNDGEHTIYYYSGDNVGNNETIKSEIIYIDNSAPISSISFTPENPPYFINSSTVFTIFRDDSSGSGIDHTYYKVGDDGEWIFNDGTPFTIMTTEGLQQIYYYSGDKLGNIEPIREVRINFDETAPITTLDYIPESPPNYVNSSTLFSLVSEDNPYGVGGVETRYKVNNGTWMNYNGSPFTLEDVGTHIIYYYSVDIMNNIELTQSQEVILSTDISPLTDLIFTPEYPPNYVNFFDNIFIFAVYDGTGSGIAETRYRINGGNWILYDNNMFTLSGTGTFIIDFYSINNLGAIEVERSQIVFIDEDAPLTSINFIPVHPPHFVNPTTEFKLQTNDGSNGAGIAETRYKVDAGVWIYYDETPFTISGPGNHFIYYYSIDNVGNEESEQVFIVYIDDNAPISELSYKIEYPPDYVNRSTLFKLIATDRSGSGIAEKRYKIDNGNWNVYSNPFTLNGEGSHNISYYSIDNVGNEEVQYEITITLDEITPKTKIDFIPETPPNYVNSSTLFTLSATDIAGSGVAKIFYKIDFGFFIPYANIPFNISGPGPHSIYYYSIDNVGNEEEMKIETVFITDGMLEDEIIPTNKGGSNPLLFIVLIGVIAIAGLSIGIVVPGRVKKNSYNTPSNNKSSEFTSLDKINQHTSKFLANSCLNILLTKSSNETGDFYYYSDPQLVEDKDLIADGLILNDDGFLHERLLNPINGDYLIRKLKINPNKIDHIKAIQFFFMNELSEKKIKEINLNYNTFELMNFIVVFSWTAFDYGKNMEYLKNLKLEHSKNLKIIDKSMFTSLIGLKGKYVNQMNKIIHHTRNLKFSALKKIENSKSVIRYDTEDLRIDLNKKGLLKYDFDEYFEYLS